MTIQEAIKLVDYHPSRIKHPEELFLDPLFWQALGKGLRRPEGKIVRYDDELIEAWLCHAYRFFKCIMAGKSPEDFFKELKCPTSKHN